LRENATSQEKKRKSHLLAVQDSHFRYSLINQEYWLAVSNEKSVQT